MVGGGAGHCFRLTPSSHPLVLIGLYDSAVGVDLAVLHLLPPQQSTTAVLLIALHPVHFSTCLLILVISSVPAKLRLITAAYQMEMEEALRGAGTDEMRREVTERMREQGREEMRRWE